MKRVIARLDIKGPNVIKTVRTEGLRVVGDPKAMAKKYYDDGADELIYIDVVASLYGRNLDFDQLRAVSEEVFVPFTVGGGIRSLHDIALALSAGADKVAINTFATHNPEFLGEAVKKFGAQSIVLSIEAKKIGEGKWEAYTDGGREKTGLDAVSWAKNGLELGVGEILITSVDKDGTREGYDLELVKEISAISGVPVVAHGGAGSFKDVVSVLKSGADAVSISSVLHYNLLSVKDVKKAVRQAGLDTRI